MDKAKGYICIALSTVLFSTLEITLKSTAALFNPVQLTMIRFFIAGAALVPMAAARLRRGGGSLDAKAIGKLAALGFVGLFIGMNIYQMSLAYTKASVVSVLFSTNTLFVTLFALPVLGEKIEKKSIIAIAFQIIGVIMIIQPWNTRLSAVGVTLALLSAAAFAIYGVLGKGESTRYGGVVTTCVCSLAAGAEILIYSAISHIPAVSSFMNGIGMTAFADVPLFSGITSRNIFVLLYAGAVVTGGGYMAYFMAMEHLKAQTVSLVFFFKPMLAPVLAMIILNEVIPFSMVIGIVIMLLGSSVALFGDRLFRRGFETAQRLHL